MPNLNITDAEAAMLAAVLAYVGGSPTDSPREYAQSLSKKLDDLGYSFTRGKAEEFHKLIQSVGEGKYAGMQFKNYEKSFVPGYFQYDSGAVEWKDFQPNLRYWTRVNVTPVSDRQPGDELSEEDLYALPVGAEVRDRDADTWTKATNGCWYLSGNDEESANASSGDVTEYSPIHLVSE